MKSPIYLRRALIAGTAAALAVAGVAVGAAPSYATPAVNPVAPPLNGCPTSNANPGLTQQPIQTATDINLTGFSVDPSGVTPSYTTPSELSGPGGIGYGIVNCAGASSYVVGSDAKASTGQQWEGVTTYPALGAGTSIKTVSTSIYVDPKEPTQLAGFATTDGSHNVAVVYSATGVTAVKNPFTGGSNAPTINLPAGWSVYNVGSGGWSSFGTAPAGTNGWSTVEITLDANDPTLAHIYINGAERTITAGGTTTFAGNLTNATLFQYNNADGHNSFDTYYQGLSYSLTYQTPYTVNRLSGSDRYATAVAISQNEFPNGFVNGTGTVVLATGQNYADALTGAPLAALEDGPLLLTQTNSLPSEVAAEIKRLDPANVIVLGGFGAVANSVYTQVRALVPGVNLVQVGGADRYATSLMIAQNYFSSPELETLDNGIVNNKVDTAFIATGTAFPDALSAAPAAGTNKFPVLLVNGTSNTIPNALGIWLQTNVTNTLYVAGGSGAVSPAVVNQLASNIKGSVHPFSGTDRYDTNFLINGNNTQSQNTNVTAGVRFFNEPDTVYLATGLDYPDALSGGAAAGIDGAPLFLTNGTCVPANVLSTIASWGSVHTINVLGGTGAQAAAIESLKSC